MNFISSFGAVVRNPLLACNSGVFRRAGGNQSQMALFHEQSGISILGPELFAVRVMFGLFLFFFFFFLFFRPLYYAMELLQQNVILRHELLLPNGAGILDPLSGSIAV